MKQPIIRSRAPVRISFAGGGTDVSPFTETHEGAVVAVSINQYSHASMQFRRNGKVRLIEEKDRVREELPANGMLPYGTRLDLIKSVINHYHDHLGNGFEFGVHTDVPPRSGLGGSASLAVAAIGVFNTLHAEKGIDKYEIAELAYKLEREELKNAGGRQDQYASVFGGINFIEFKGNNFVRVHPLNLKPDTLLELETNLLLLYLGSRMDSGHIIEEQTRNVKTNTQTMEAMIATKKLAYDVKYSLLRGNLKLFGELLDEGWRLKKQFAKSISNPRIDGIYVALKKAGALGAKITGAGGGGHMIVYCAPGRKHQVIRKAEKLGARVVPFSFDFEGLVTWKAER